MNIIATSEFWALVFVIAGLYTALKILAARREINATNKKHQDDEQAKEDEKLHRRMVHEADAYNEAASTEPPFFRTPLEKEEFFAQIEADRQARSREAVRRAQIAARESRTSSASDRELFMPVIEWSASRSSSASDSQSSSSQFSGGGGSFDGGGASGDWGGSSSSSSSSSDCSSSSSDSGGSCGGSSD